MPSQYDVVLQCGTNVYDCLNPATPVGATCTIGTEPHDDDTLQAYLALAAVFAAAMAFGLGANDSANSWGPSVGSGAISMRKALLLGGVCEWLGASLLGYGVAGTIQHATDIEDPECWRCGYCESKMGSYAVGMFCALVATCVVLALATFTAMPVSTTHAIVGGVVGFTLAGTSASCINWSFSGGVGGIVASWVLSPALAGALGVGMFRLTRSRILDCAHPRASALKYATLLFAGTTWLIALLVVIKSPPTKQLPLWLCVVVATLIGALAYGITVAWGLGYINARLPSVLPAPQQAVEKVHSDLSEEGKHEISALGAGLESLCDKCAQSRRVLWLHRQTAWSKLLVKVPTSSTRQTSSSTHPLTSSGLQSWRTQAPCFGTWCCSKQCLLPLPTGPTTQRMLQGRSWPSGKCTSI
eukprot:TRINITY_DN2002_c0_g1_i8.p1 TRINITY_DN2002_c0_g1~~TRINITY_DN2002_c0_g1_i8.p1  ORF type:complete len:414 (+),score=49.24 TRINITY_DN2002_c0_g1_i8:168-1409(+)